MTDERTIVQCSLPHQSAHASKSDVMEKIVKNMINKRTNLLPISFKIYTGLNFLNNLIDLRYIKSKNNHSIKLY